MKQLIILKMILIIALAVVGIAFLYVTVSARVSGKYEGPSISCPSEILEISVKDSADVLLTDVTAFDPQDGDLTEKIRPGAVSKLINADTAKVTFYVFDSDNNMASLVRYVRYTDYRIPTIAVEEPLIFENLDTADPLEYISAYDVVDGDLTNDLRISMLAPTPSSTVYDVTVQVTNSLGDTARVRLPVQIVGKRYNVPNIVLKKQLVYLSSGDAFQAEDYLARVELNGTVVSRDKVTVEGSVDTSRPDTYWVWYRYSDGNTQGTAILTVVVE